MISLNYGIILKCEAKEERAKRLRSYLIYTGYNKSLKNGIIHKLVLLDIDVNIKR